MNDTVIYLSLGAWLFSIGLFIVFTRKNAILILIGLELMLNAANLNLIAFNRLHSPRLDGQLFALFIIVIAVCEAAVGIAIILKAYRYYQTVIPNEIQNLKEHI
jgi:NADH:ubiquinone oxidoreductase subunit K